MIRYPPDSPRTDTRFPYPTLFRSRRRALASAAVESVDRLRQPVCSHRSVPFGAGRRSLTQELRQASQEVLDILLGGEEVRRDADPAVVRPDENCLFCGAAHNGLGIGAAKADVASMALLPCRRHHFKIGRAHV